MGILRTVWSLFALLLLFVAKYLHCNRLTAEGDSGSSSVGQYSLTVPGGGGGSSSTKSIDYTEIMSPVFILMQFIMIRACQLH